MGVQMFDIPRDKNYTPPAGQCDGCGGNGCSICNGRGWLPMDHPSVRRCAYGDCGLLHGVETRRVLPPEQVAVYCSNECAYADA